MKIAISTESSCDLPQELLKEYDIKIISFPITLGTEEFKDGRYTTEVLFELVDKYKALPKTTALNEFEYTEYYENLLKDYDAVIHLCMSSGLSSSCGNGLRAAENMKNVYAIDTESLTTGMGLLAIYARELSNGGLSAKEVAEKVEERKRNLKVSFVLERLDYMHKGGRCSGVELLGANILKIRPRIVMKDTKLVSDKKYRGSMIMVVEKYLRELFVDVTNFDFSRVFITYSTATAEILATAEKVCKEVGFKDIIFTRTSGTVACHCGPNTIGAIFFSDGAKK